MTRRPLLGIALAIGGILPSWCCGQATTVTPSKIEGVHAKRGEEILWNTATSIIMPTYPEASISAARAGVSVALIRTTTSGGIKRVDVLEAPDAPIAEAVRRALSQWKFAPTTVDGEAEGLEVVGRLTFYFDLNGRVPRVLTASQAAQAREQMTPPSPAR